MTIFHFRSIRVPKFDELLSTFSDIRRCNLVVAVIGWYALCIDIPYNQTFVSVFTVRSMYESQKSSTYSRYWRQHIQRCYFVMTVFTAMNVVATTIVSYFRFGHYKLV